MDDLINVNKEGVVVGLRGVAGVVPRMEIDQLLLEKPDTFNLFLLALKSLQDDPDHTDLMGYFQVAGTFDFSKVKSVRIMLRLTTGIHGLPKATWRGVEWPDKKAENTNPSGYCVHGSPKFPTWHRPYLAMFEVSDLPVNLICLS